MRRARARGCRAASATAARPRSPPTERDAGDDPAVYELYGFEAVETPFIEYTEALGKFLPDQDRPNEGVFSFQDDDEQWLSLRYDLTAPLARYVAENFDKLPKPYRSYRAGSVFRNEKPGPGRFRQFMQFDADTVGAASPAADAEICMMAADTLEALGIPRGGYVIKVNNRKVLDGVMEAIGLGGEENAGRRLTVLRAIDKLDRLGPEGVRALAWAPAARMRAAILRRARGSTPAKPMSFDLVSSIPTTRRWPNLLSGSESNSVDDGLGNAITNAETLRLLRGHFAGSKNSHALDELEQIADFVQAGEYGSSRIRIDPSVVRGLEYYTGPVFEAELTFEVPGEDGKPVRFGSVGGGGRYDGLVGRFRGENVPATGFSIGVSRLYAALKAVGSPIVSAKPEPGPVVVLALDKDQLAALPELRRRVARGKHPRRTLSRPVRHERAAQIRRQARLDLRRHSRLERARKGRSRHSRSRARRRTRRLDEGPRGLPGAARQGAIRGSRSRAGCGGA